MNILFICKYNRFRSRIAQAVFNKLNKNKSHKAKSAGLIQGRPQLDRTEVKVAKSLGIKLAGKPQGISTKLLKWQDTLVIVANDVPANIFDQKKYGKKLLKWNIPDTKAENLKEVETIIKAIENKVTKFVGEIQ